MNTIQLKLKAAQKTDVSKRGVAGWHSSSSPEDWLKEVTQLKKNGVTTDMRISPVTLADKVYGALITTKDGEDTKFSNRVLPLIELLPNVFVHKDTNFNASLLEHEISYLFTAHLHLYLPSIGLISFEQKDSLPPSAFITGLLSQTSWNHAVAAPPKSPKLSAIIVPLPEAENFDLESINEDGIGELSDKKIKSTKEDSNMLGKIGTGAALGLGGLAAAPILGLGKLVNMLPNGPGSVSPTLFDKLEQWASKNFQNLANARQRELNKLMDLMEKDPELGLKYALPLGGHEARRGRAAPGWQLGMRNTQLGANQGGSAVDGWDINHDTQLKLEAQYRKAAADAEAKEQFERAAYIYGELLNDWSSAARMLIKAGRPRDAVGIYLHKLHDQSRAAKCLEDAGLITQAAELYHKIKMYEKAGDLYDQLNLNDLAEQSWAKAVETEKSPIDKARITFEKLKQFENAVLILDTSWRNGNQTNHCLRRQFLYLQQLEKNQESVALLKNALESKKQILTDLEKAKLCYSIYHDYSQEDLRAIAKESILIITSNTLQSKPTSNDAKSLLKELPNLEKSNVLLERDTKRFTIQSSDIKPVNLSQRSGHLRPHYIIGIPLAAKWQSLTAVAENVSIAGCSESMLAVAQVQKRSCHGSHRKTEDYPGGNQTVHHIGLNSHSIKARVFHFLEGKKIHYRSVNKSRTQAHNRLGAIPNVLSLGTVDSEGFMLLCYTDTGALIAQYFDINGSKINTVTLDLAPPDIKDAQWLCCQRQNHACFSANQFAAWRYPSGEIVSIQLGAPIHKLEFSPAPFTLKALLSGTHEVCLISPGKSGKKPDFINLYTSNDNYKPVSCYTKNGDIIIACGSDGSIYSNEKTLNTSATFTIPSNEGHPIDITPHGSRGFVILTSKSKLLFFE